MVLLMQYFRLSCFLFLNFFISLMCVWLQKNYCIVYLYAQTSQIDCFRSVHKILRWIGSSDFKKDVVLTIHKHTICVVLHVLTMHRHSFFHCMMIAYRVSVWLRVFFFFTSSNLSLLGLWRGLSGCGQNGTRRTMKKCMRRPGEG